MSRRTTQQPKSSNKGSAKKKIPSPQGTSRGKRSTSQTNQPFEQDVKRRIGQFGGAGEPPLMKK